MKKNVTTLGETMVRLSIPVGERIETARDAQFYTAGSESNTASALARLGLETAWVSRLTENALGRRVAADIARQGVDVSRVLWTREDRVGVFFVEFAPPPRATTVVYDRRESAMAKLCPDDLDWSFLLETEILHLTGITPALSETCRAVVVEAVRRAREGRVPVSFDVNYRAGLWPPSEAARVLGPLLAGATVVISTRADAEALFGLGGTDSSVLRAMHERFGARVTALTLGGRGAIATDGQRDYEAPAYPVSEVDRLGAGDAFDAGLLYGYLQGDLALGMRYGSAMSAVKMGILGDYLVASREEIEQVIEKGGVEIRR